jgi:hypothetical protein
VYECIRGGPPEIGEQPGANALRQCFFYCQIFAKSLPEKYDFDLKEGFSTLKKNLKFAIFI